MPRTRRSGAVLGQEQDQMAGAAAQVGGLARGPQSQGAPRRVPAQQSHLRPMGNAVEGGGDGWVLDAFGARQPLAALVIDAPSDCRQHGQGQSAASAVQLSPGHGASSGLEGAGVRIRV